MILSVVSCNVPVMNIFIATMKLTVWVFQPRNLKLVLASFLSQLQLKYWDLLSQT